MVIEKNRKGGFIPFNVGIFYVKMNHKTSVYEYNIFINLGFASHQLIDLVKNRKTLSETFFYRLIYLLFLHPIIEKTYETMNDLNQQQPSLISYNTDSNILADQVELNKSRKEDCLNFFHLFI